MNEPKWRDIQHQRPDPNREIWVWDNEKGRRVFVRYHGSWDSYKDFKYNETFPLWAYVWEIE